MIDELYIMQSFQSQIFTCNYGLILVMNSNPAKGDAFYYGHLWLQGLQNVLVKVRTKTRITYYPVQG